ncbi:unnamed protein product [Amoebophrya sp. A120]|nr:unnamed protein product [Amoebophrya sp. A120]|eukprot:GSA120T00021687001.1
MKIFFAAVPMCLDPGLWSGMWRESNETRSHVLHSHISELLLTLDAVHSFLQQFETPVRTEADWVYLPVYFPLLFWYESTESLTCVREFFQDYDFGALAGYDHLINYGHEFPHWKKESRVLPPENRLLDLNGYHLFLRNAFVLTVGHTHQGRRNFALALSPADLQHHAKNGTTANATSRTRTTGEQEQPGGERPPFPVQPPSSSPAGAEIAHPHLLEPGWGGLLELQRFVLHPYFVSFDCHKAYKGLVDFASRPVRVLFVGAVKHIPDTTFVFRERLYVLEAVQRHFKGDESVYFQPVPADDGSRQQLRRKQDEYLLLYESARFCLVMPGDGNTAQRLFHVLTRGCVPVFVYHKDSYVVLPFEAYLQYEEFSLLYLVDSVDETAAALESVLQVSLETGQRLQKKALEAAPYLSMKLEENCAQYGTTGSAFTLLERELRDRLHWRARFLVPRGGFARPYSPREHSHWVHWGALHNFDSSVLADEDTAPLERSDLRLEEQAEGQDASHQKADDHT